MKSSILAVALYEKNKFFLRGKNKFILICLLVALFVSITALALASGAVPLVEGKDIYSESSYQTNKTMVETGEYYWWMNEDDIAAVKRDLRLYEEAKRQGADNPSEQVFVLRDVYSRGSASHTGMAEIFLSLSLLAVLISAFGAWIALNSFGDPAEKNIFASNISRRDFFIGKMIFPLVALTTVYWVFVLHLAAMTQDLFKFYVAFETVNTISVMRFSELFFARAIGGYFAGLAAFALCVFLLSACKKRHIAIIIFCAVMALLATGTILGMAKAPVKVIHGEIDRFTDSNYRSAWRFALARFIPITSSEFGAVYGFGGDFFITTAIDLIMTITFAIFGRKAALSRAS